MVLWIKTDNTAYQALVLDWLGCGKIKKACLEQNADYEATKVIDSVCLITFLIPKFLWKELAALVDETELV